MLKKMGLSGLTDLSMFTQAQQEFRNRNSETQIFANALLPMDRLKELIVTGNAYILEQDDTIAVLYQEKECYRMYCIYTTCKTAMDIAVQGTIMTDIVFSNENSKKSNEIFVKWLESGGFINYRENLQMLLIQSNDSDRHIEIPEGYYVDLLPDAAKVEALWTTYLDPYSIEISGREEIERRISSGNVFTLKNEKGEIVCAALEHRVGNKVLIQHVVTESKDRNKGLAKKILSIMIEELGKERAGYFWLWVEKRNTPAVKLYQSLGFCIGKACSVQYRQDL